MSGMNGSAIRATVVSDDPAFLQVAAEVLEYGGYTVTVLMEAADVAARIVASRPALMCVETEPGKDGALAAVERWAREQPELADVPTLLLTSDGASVPAQHGDGAGAASTRLLLLPQQSGLESFLASVTELISSGAERAVETRPVAEDVDTDVVLPDAVPGLTPEPS